MNRLITTVTLNPTWDYRLRVDKLYPGQVHVANMHQLYPGGKGINVARALRRLGMPVLATGLAGSQELREYAKTLRDGEKIRNDFCGVPGQIRRCVLLNDQFRGEDTVINLPSLFKVQARHFQDLLKKVERYAGQSDLVTFSGTLAQNMRPDSYAQLIEAAHRAGAIAFLDIREKPLLLALPKNPFLVKLTQKEYEKTFGSKLSGGFKSKVKALVRLRQMGAEMVLMTLGEKGSLCLAGREVWRAWTTQKISGAAATGSGDAFLAGFCKAYLEKQTLAEVLRYATATAISSLLNLGSGFVQPRQVQEWVKRVKVQRVAKI